MKRDTKATDGGEEEETEREREREREKV